MADERAARCGEALCRDVEADRDTWQARAEQAERELAEAREELDRLRVVARLVRAYLRPTTPEHEQQHREMKAALAAGDAGERVPDAPEPGRYAPALGERWRVGTSEGTDRLTLYRHTADGPQRGRLVGMMREPEDASLVCNAVTHWWNAEHRWEYGVEGRWPNGGINLDWRDSREDAESVLAARAEIEGNVVVSRLVRRLITTGPAEGVPDADT